MIRKLGLKETLVLQTLYDAEIQGKMFPSTLTLLREVSTRFQKSEGTGRVDFYILTMLKQKGMIIQQGDLNAHKRPFILTDAGREAVITLCAQAQFSFDEAGTSTQNEFDPLSEESALSSWNELPRGSVEFPMPSNVQPSPIENTAMIDAVLTAFTVATERFTRLAEAMEKLIVRFDVMLGEQTSRANVRQQLQSALSRGHREKLGNEHVSGNNSSNMED